MIVSLLAQAGNQFDRDHPVAARRSATRQQGCRAAAHFVFRDKRWNDAQLDLQIRQYADRSVVGTLVKARLPPGNQREIIMTTLNSVRVSARVTSVAVFLLSGAASYAGITGTGGSAVQIAPPASTVLGATEHTTQAWAFNEVTGLTLAAALSVDATTPGVYASPGVLTPGTIPAGTVINSHYLYSDPVGDALGTYEGFVDFDQPILGVIVLRSSLNATDALLGAPGTTYGDNAARGLELSANADRFVISISQTRVSFRFLTTSATDDIRIITAPAPGMACSMLGAGLVLLARRRR